ncbi:hypothetical protein DQ04_19611000 [Trypanosoma grayi]|uniref:hypothetical protein n=1 Tax=Trypanosoma grayi TaxID=71804 RepID=UPI0004F3F766|nr:hypothetical protein DQ04_19611000 [Trypanosoma grayi]KEG05655.1 hypothetical protein DQ04_19611000 [Trypanosoma grayi]
MMMMRYVLFVCVLCVCCACGCAGDEVETVVATDCTSGGTTQCNPSQDLSPGADVSPGLEGAAVSANTCPGDGKTIPPCAKALETVGDSNPKGGSGVGPKVCTPPEVAAQSGEDPCQQSEEVNERGDGGSRIGETAHTNKAACKEPSDPTTCTPSSSLSSVQATQSQTNMGATAGGGGDIGNVLLPGAGGLPGAPGPAGPTGAAGAKSADGGREIGASNGKALADCPAEVADRAKCQVGPALQKAQVPSQKPGKGLVSGGTLDGRGGSEITQSDKGVRQDTQSEGHDDSGHAGTADGECGDGKLKESNTDCKQKDEDRSTQSDQREKDRLQPKNTQAPEVNAKPENPLDEKNDAKNSAASPPAPDSPETESAAADRTNLEPAESPAQTAVEQSDAVQSQTSSSSASTSATEATGGSSQPSSSSPSTDKGQDPKAADSSSGPVWVHAPPLLLLLSVIWLGGLAVTAVC